MSRRAVQLALILLVLCMVYPLTQAAAATKRATVDATAGSSCDSTFKSATGPTVVTVCPTVVESGQMLHFIIRSRPNEPVLVLLRYPNGIADTRSDTTDAAGVAAVDMTVRYNPLYRYGQAQFQVSVGTSGAADADVVTGTVRVAQSTSVGKPRLRVRAVGAKDWCPDNGRCTVRNNSSIVIRVDTDPNAQVQVDLAYPSGVTLPCPGNELAGGTGAFADGSGAFQCTMSVSYTLPNPKASATVLVQATVTTSSETIPVQYKLWIKGK